MPMQDKARATIIFITGGARSGKSSYAQQQALALSSQPIYVATAKKHTNDEEFSQRINRHISDRDERWITIEEQMYISKLLLNDKIVVIDCVTLWLSNFFSLYNYDSEKALKAIKDEIDAIEEIQATFFIISNEIGMGVHAASEMGRKFTDLQGWANQHIALRANNVILMVSGIPVVIKEQL